MTPPIHYYRAAFRTPFGYSKKDKVHVPTLLIWGDPDQALDTELAFLAKDYMTNLQVKVIEESNHFVMVDKPKECNAAITEFLKGK